MAEAYTIGAARHRGFNSYKVSNGVAYLELTDFDGNLIGHALIDESDLPNLIRLGKRLTIVRKTNTNYAAMTLNGRRIRLHRLLLDATEGSVIDHINGNGLDNRRNNLRVVETFENARNRKSSNRNNTSSKVRNVSVDRKSPARPYLVRLFEKRKIIYSARCKTLNTAAITATMARAQRWGVEAA